MNNFEEKKSLILEMISFSLVDGVLHPRELHFMEHVAKELGFSKSEFLDLFHEEMPKLPIPSEFDRIKQLYRLALLMHSDGQLHQHEALAIRQIALEMGLNPYATQRMLRLMKASPNVILDPSVVIALFREEHN